MNNSPINRFSSTLALIAPTMALLATHADAAIYIKFDGVDGESTSVDHKEWIIVESMSWGANAPAAGSGGGAGKVSFKEFTVTKRIDKASPQLFLKCATGRHIPKVTLSVTRMVKEVEVEYYQIILTDVLITSIGSESPQAPAGTPSGDARPLESVGFKWFPKVEIRYTPVNDVTGDKGEVISSGELETDATTTAG
jgi:type VI secretion system secreted protein Hcp